MVWGIEYVLSGKPNSRLQKYRLTDKGRGLMTRQEPKEGGNRFRNGYATNEAIPETRRIDRLVCEDNIIQAWEQLVTKYRFFMPKPFRDIDYVLQVLIWG